MPALAQAPDEMIDLSAPQDGDAASMPVVHKRQASPSLEGDNLVPAKRKFVAKRDEMADQESDLQPSLSNNHESQTHNAMSVRRTQEAQRFLKQALLKRKHCLQRELLHLEAGGSLLTFVDVKDSPLAEHSVAMPSSEAPRKPRSSADTKGTERWPGLTDDDKLLLQKAKAIEAKNKYKVKWPEPPRRKIHHDYLMEEMSWLAGDFRNERKWKIAQAKKVASAVVKYHSQKQQKAERAEKDKETQVRKNASKIAREVRRFWSQIETLAQHKQQAQVDLEKKKVLGKHLDFLVDQTEKYSTMIAQNLNTLPTALRGAPETQSVPASNSEAEPVKKRASKLRTYLGSSSVPRESDPTSAQTVTGADAVDEELEKGDEDFAVVEDEVDDEATIEEDEKNEDKAEIANEVSELQAEQDMPLEQLLAKYGRMVADSRDEEDEGDDSDEDEEQDENDDDDDEGEKRADPADEDAVGALENGARRCAEDELSSSENMQPSGVHDALHNGHDPSEPQMVCSTDTLEQDGASDGEGQPAANKDEESAVLSAEAKDVADVARTLAPTGHTLATTHVKTAVPFLLSKNLKMREYQHIALDWMIALYDKGLNGILADEMGLGKTIMTISVLAYLACERGIWGPHLIVVPTSLLLNWEIELKRWCPSFKVLTYYGSLKERKLKRQGWSKANSFHVCITSYKMVVQDQKMFRRKKWKYLILDEAHNIKNFQSQRWQVLLNFRTKRRLLLTGTPLQNNLMELWSLLHFLMPHIFTSHSEFKDWFANPLMSMVEGNSAMNDTLVHRLHSVLRPFILRRLKKDVEKQLPEKKEHIVSCRLSKRQRCLYDDFLAAGATQTKLASGNLLEIINVLMQLRKVCNHPDLFEERPIVSPFDCLPISFRSAGDVQQVCNYDPLSHVSLSSLNFVLSELETMSKVDADLIREIAPTPKLIVEVCSEGSTGLVTDATVVESGRGIWKSVAQYKSHVAAKRQCVKSVALASMLQVNGLRCSAVPVFGNDLCRLVRVSSGASAVLGLSENPREYFSYTNTLRDLVLSADERVFGRGGQEATCQDRARRPQYDCAQREVSSLLDMLTNFVCIIPKARSAPVSVTWSHPDRSAAIELESIGVKVAQTYSACNDVCRPAHIRQQLYFPDKRLLQYDCGKLQVMDGMLRRLKAEGHRVLLFTQMSKVLDVVETFLCFHGHTYIRLDGSTKIEMRQKLVERFNQDPKIFVFISSTRAGGVGINLTGADTVIFYDSDWNPAMDRQAQDRCHRIGQTREVHIYRLVSEHTVEENILKKANQKRHLEDLALKDSATSLFNPDFFKKMDVRELFENEAVVVKMASSKPGAAKAKTKKSTISDKEWETATANAEDERDVEAMKMAKEEEKEEMHEFKAEEEQPMAADADGAGSQSEDGGRVDAVSLAIESELTGVQRYALRLVEEMLKESGTSLVERVRVDKQGWERQQARRIREEDQQRIYDEDEVLLYQMHGASAQG